MTITMIFFPLNKISFSSGIIKSRRTWKRSVGLMTQKLWIQFKEGSFLVDKTMLIKDWWDNKDSVTLIARPRRFGKTLNMNMLECFFSTEYSGRADLFEGLDIWSYEEFRSLQGTYPVISLSFAKLKNNSAAGIKEKSVKLTRKSNQILRSCWAEEQ